MEPEKIQSTNPVPSSKGPTNPVVIVASPRFTEIPKQMDCPVCQKHIVTQRHHTNGLLTWISCGALAFIGCFWGCCLIPFCVSGLKNVEHICPNCNNVVGIYKRL